LADTNSLWMENSPIPENTPGNVLRTYPSFSIPRRVRWQNDLRLSYELVKDFMLTVTLFDAYDSKPQSAEATKNDFGTTLAISWTF
jgi:hypothetical protein